MTIQDQIDQLKKELSGISEQLEKKIEKLQDHITDTSKKVKPTRYYPNGAYMDEPEAGVMYFCNNEDAVPMRVTWDGDSFDSRMLYRQNCFPTEEAAENDIERNYLTAKMYKDMRDERINGEWVAGSGENFNYFNHKPFRTIGGNLYTQKSVWKDEPHDFYYKNETFIEDLKALGWSEEELKIVWFNN